MGAVILSMPVIGGGWDKVVEAGKWSLVLFIAPL
jgi:hypothetical protein